MSDPPNVIQTTPLSRLTKFMAWGNRANAALLALTGAMGVFSMFSQPSSDLLSSALLSLYVVGSGALLLRYEMAVGVELRRDYGFMYTYAGRAAFLLLAGNLAWTCKPLGLPTAVITNANALFSAYVMWQHPSFVAGHASAVAIGGFDEAGGDELLDGQIATSDRTFDPSSSAARSRDAGFL